MILFLQGASHSGKTTFAKYLARLTGASVMSLDLLKMGLIKSGNSDFSGLTPEDDDAIAERLWPIVREMALVADENGQSLIVEGVSLPFVEAGKLAHGLGKSRAAAFAIVFSEKIHPQPLRTYLSEGKRIRTSCASGSSGTDRFVVRPCLDSKRCHK